MEDVGLYLLTRCQREATMRRRLSWLVAASCCILMVGCYQKTSTDAALEFVFRPWVRLTIVLAGLAAVPAGVVLMARNQRFWGICLAIAGPVGAGVVAPGMYLDRVVVSETGFYSRHGFWWSPTIHEIRYDELKVVNVVVEEKAGRRGKTYSYYFDCALKSGNRERVPLGDIMREALPEIAD